MSGSQVLLNRSTVLTWFQNVVCWPYWWLVCHCYILVVSTRVIVYTKFWMPYNCFLTVCSFRRCLSIGTLLFCGVARYCHAVFLYSADTVFSGSCHNEKCKLNKHNICSYISFGMFYLCLFLCDLLNTDMNLLSLPISPSSLLLSFLAL